MTRLQFNRVALFANLSKQLSENRSRRLFLLIFCVIGAVAFASLWDSFNYNLIMLSSGARTIQLAGQAGIWYGIGLHNLADEDKDMIGWALRLPMYDECAAQEQHALHTFLSIPQMRGSEQNERRRIILQARQKVCEGQLAEASLLLESTNDAFIQQIVVMRKLGQRENALSRATQRICLPDEAWCQWCVWQMYDADDKIVGGGTQSDPVMHYSNALQGNSLRASMTVLDPLIYKSNFNVTVLRRVPLVVGEMISQVQEENYIEYLTLPIGGSEVRYRVRGVLIDDSQESCIYPRLVFWGKTGNYLGEIAPHYVVQSRFDIELWAALPPETTNVTPRITFSNGCFAKGQAIAICLVDLAVSSR